MKNALFVLLIIIIGLLLWFMIAPPAFVANIIGTATTTEQVQNNGTNNTDTSSQTQGSITREGGSDRVVALANRVVIDAPKANGPVFKNFTVTGKAPGPWYFEASFPIEVRNPQGVVVATGHATALTEWMTEDDVAFKAEITVSNYTGPATLVLFNDNASGLPENAGSVSMPITIQAQ